MRFRLVEGRAVRMRQWLSRVFNGLRPVVSRRRATVPGCGGPRRATSGPLRRPRRRAPSGRSCRRRRRSARAAHVASRQDGPCQLVRFGQEHLGQHGSAEVSGPAAELAAAREPGLAHRQAEEVVGPARWHRAVTEPPDQALRDDRAQARFAPRRARSPCRGAGRSPRRRCRRGRSSGSSGR